MKKKNNTKKVFVFILEGWSDKSALEGILKKIYQNRYIYSVVMYGDITSDEKIKVGDVENFIYKKVKEKTEEDKIKLSDIVNIFQICDTDGAFIPKENIVLEDSKDVKYSSTCISTCDVNGIIKRNVHKKEVINYLLSKNSIKSIPYKLFFMSCNLDHVLYNEQNLDDDLKVEYADGFFNRFQNCPTGFIEFLEQNSFGVPKNLIDSWKYISKDLHSLERHNNFFLCFEDHPPYAQ